MMAEYDLRVVSWDKPFPPQTAFGHSNGTPTETHKAPSQLSCLPGPSFVVLCSSVSRRLAHIESAMTILPTCHRVLKKWAKVQLPTLPRIRPLLPVPPEAPCRTQRLPLTSTHLACSNAEAKPTGHSGVISLIPEDKCCRTQASLREIFFLIPRDRPKIKISLPFSHSCS